MINKKLTILFYLLFFLSRVFVLLNPPYKTEVVDGNVKATGYSDVKHDYERYANMWRYGLTPYRKHLYEYPPATIPLAALALEIDQRGVGNFYFNYRAQNFVLELILFSLIILTLKKLTISFSQKILALSFYVLMAPLAKDYWYEGLDLIFMGTFTAGLCWRFLVGHQKLWQRIVFWSLFWASVALKFMTAPLLAPLLFLRVFNKKQWKKELAAYVLGFLVVWGLPMALYRSSLSVMFFFHGERPLKYESFGTFVILAINDFTQSETQTDIKPHYPIVGPVAGAVTKIVDLGFPLALLIWLLWSLWQIRQKQKGGATLSNLAEFKLMLKITLVYIFVVFLTGKIFSRPFHLWYVPIITIYPFKSIRTQIIYYLSAAWMLLLDTTGFIKVSTRPLFGPISLSRIRDFTRFVPMMLLLRLSTRLSRTRY